MRKLSLALTLLTTLAMVGCRFPGGLPALNQPEQGPVEGAAVRMPAPPLSGRVTFAQLQTLAGAPDVASGATVSLINTGSNQTVSTALTNANGEFVLNFTNGYVADPTATYFLEAVKGLDSNQPGNQAVRLRTVAKFSSGWTSITSATANSGTMISPSTTALSIGAGLVNGKPDAFNFASLVGSVSGGETPAYAPVSGLSADDYTSLLGLVQQILADAQDPVANVGLTLNGPQRVWSRLNVAPSVTSFTPAQAKVGEGVTVAGTGFSPIAASNVLAFNGEKAVTTGVTSSSMTSSVPEGATSGPTSLQVGSLTVLGPNFSVLPVVSDFSPKQGEPGTIVTVTGTGFDGKTKTNNMVEFNGVAGTITESTATQLKVKVPAGATNGVITVTVNGQRVTTSIAYSADLSIRTVAGAWTPRAVSADTWRAAYISVLPDAEGNVYATAGNTVVKISKAGTLSTVAGTGAYGYAGDGGPATKARLHSATDLVLDSKGNLYISDQDNGRVRMISALDGTISTVAGTGGSWQGDNVPATLSALRSPTSLAMDSEDNLYITEAGMKRVRKVNAADGKISTVMSGLNSPQGLAIDKADTLYVADMYNHRVLMLADGQSTPTPITGLNYPHELAVDASGSLYIAERSNSNRVLKVIDGLPTAIALPTGISYLGGFAVDASGAYYIADQHGQKIFKVIDAQLSVIAGQSGDLASGDALSVKIGYPTSLAEDVNGDLYFADESNEAIWKLSQGMLSPVNTNGPLNDPQALVMDKGILYVADTFNDRVLTINHGEVSTLYASASLRPNALAVDRKDGTLYISSGQLEQVYKLANNELSTVDMGQNVRPRALALDAAGNLYVADVNTQRILKRSATDGNVSVVAGSGGRGYTGDGGLAIHATFYNPNGLTFDAAGNLYIADRENNAIRKVNLTDGTISTVVGNGNEDYSGDGGHPRKASLDYPKAVLVGASGTLYIADTDNKVIRAVGFF